MSTSNDFSNIEDEKTDKDLIGPAPPVLEDVSVSEIVVPHEESKEVKIDVHTHICGY